MLFSHPFSYFNGNIRVPFFIGRPPKLPILSYFAETDGAITKIYSPREWDKIWKKLFPNRMSFFLTLFWYLHRMIQFYFPKNDSRSYLFLAIVIKHYSRISLYLATTLKLMALLREFTPPVNERKFGKNYFQIEWAFPSPFFVFSRDYSI